MQSIILIYLCLFSFTYPSTLDRYDQIKAKDFHLIDSDGNIIMSFSDFSINKLDSLFSMLKMSNNLINQNINLIKSNKASIENNISKIKDLDDNTSVLFNNEIHKHSIQILQIEQTLLEIKSLLNNKEKKDTSEFVKYDKAPEAIVTIQQNVEYPHYAKNKGIKGVVYINFYIDEHGYVDPNRISILKGVPALNNAAIEAVKKSVWHPAETVDGIAVGVYQNVPITFELK
tara:strand:+ start:1582 stop:2271 length:690 start_codon:yes stop_codon:yes gene_type:complete